MKRDEILKLIESLSSSQGFYGRMLQAIKELDEDERERLWEALERENFKDNLDFIFYVEG